MERRKLTRVRHAVGLTTRFVGLKGTTGSSAKECLIANLIEPERLSSMQTILFYSWPGLCETQTSYGKFKSDFSRGCECEVSRARQVYTAWVPGNWVGGTGCRRDSAGNGCGEEP